MQELKQAIKERGIIINETTLKVDSFLNHQVDWRLMKAIAKDIYTHFKHTGINKIVTIETSGIAPALYVAEYFDVPLVFLKKAKPSTMLETAYTAQVHSYTKQCDVTLSGSTAYLSKDDHVLLIDDFLANGEACKGAIDILAQANASLEGIAILIEKSNQAGHAMLENMGYEIYALARIQSMKNGTITFIDD